MHAFLVSAVQVLSSWHHRLCIWASHSLNRQLAIAALPWMLDLESSRLIVFVETVFKINIQFCCYLCCSSCVNFQNNASQCMTICVNADFCQLFLFTDAVFLSFAYANITSETVAFVTDGPAKCAPMICLLSKSDESPSCRFFHTHCRYTKSLIHWHEHHRV
jgi:hypothetical protein